ncbi:MAG: hypothetical protein GTN76_14095 [Candidatus Aenigmarchaeota archaeon]|nr:hypothetical protein [Candidatus Aenigmarchaeota archaeon]
MLKYMLVLIAILVLLTPGAQAASDIYMVLESEEISGCPCTALSNSLSVTNTGDTTDTFTFSLDLPGEWSGFIPPEKTLGIGESKDLTFYITPPCFTAAGDYSVKVKAKTSDGREFSEDVSVEVLTCHYVKIETDELKKTCMGFPVDYEIRVTNLGKVSENFEVGVTTSWGEELLSASLNIGSQKTETFDISISPSDVGTHYITITAESKDSYAKDEKKVQLDVENCYDFSIDLQPKETLTCLGGSGKYVLLINNLGSEEDEYSIYAPEWVMLNQDLITVSPKTERSVGLFAYPKVEGKGTFEIKVVSSAYPETEKTLTGTVNTIECKDVAVVVSPSEESVCHGLTKEFEVTVKNTGTITESFDLVSDVGLLEVNKVSLEAGEVQKVKLTVDSSGLDMGLNYITVTARSGEISDQNVVDLVVEDCYSLDFEVTPKEKEVCTGDEVVYTISLKNTGKFADEYTLEVDGETIGVVFITPDESKTVNTTLAVRYPLQETHDLTFKAVSKQKTFESVSTLIIKSKEECYSVELSSEEADEVKMIEIGTGVSLPMKVKNTGSREDTYKLELQGPDWVHLSEEEISLKTGEEGDVYIYASPPYGVDDGVYTAVVKAVSDNAEKELSFKFGVGEVTGTEEPIPPTTNESVTGGPPTGLITGGETTGKIILLGVITLFIIIILALKLVLFVK